FAFTKKHAYVWSGAWGAWDQVFECASDVTSWSTESYFNYLIATNNSDAPQFCIPSSSQTFAALSTIPGSDVGSYCTKAKFVVEYEGYLIFLHYTDASSNYLPDDAIWCDYVDLVNWNTGDASSGGFEGAGGISGVGKKAGFLYVFKEDSEPHKIWLVSSADVFDKTKMNGRPGCKSPDSIVNDKDGNLFYFARDFTIREIDNGVISLPIDSTVKNITPALLSKIQATFCDEYSELYWSIPVISDGVTVTENTRIVCYKDGLWNNRKIAVVAFGKYAATSTMTWDTLPFSTWDTWGWDKWDTPSGDTGFLFLTCSDSTGKTFALNGSEIDALTGLASDGWFILTTNFKSLFEYKRLLNMQFVFRAESSASVVTVYIKQDGEAEWQNADNASLAGSGEEFIFVDVPCDYR
ncbi:MAG: hypothetical protein Q7T18_12625, partial [Sedimentisphaerales bacterium]|nr:hypothetical protein [Sedimentisphaerales bacterium]